MAKRFYSPSRKGFYVDEIHGPEQIPADAVEITAEEHVGLLAGQASGKVIVIGKSGKPVAADPPAPSPEEVTARTRADIHALVLEALPDVVMALAGTDPEKAGGPGRPGINRRPDKGKAGQGSRTGKFRIEPSRY